MTQSMVYAIACTTCSNMAALKKAVFFDYYFVVHGGAAPSTSSGWVSTCNSYGVSSILNHGTTALDARDRKIHIRCCPTLR